MTVLATTIMVVLALLLVVYLDELESDIQILRFRSRKYLFVSQCQYILDVLEGTGMANCKMCSTPSILMTSYISATIMGDPVSHSTQYRSPVGTLQYLTLTWPNISYAVQ